MEKEKSIIKISIYGGGNITLADKQWKKIKKKKKKINYKDLKIKN